MADVGALQQGLHLRSTPRQWCLGLRVLDLAPMELSMDHLRQGL